MGQVKAVIPLLRVPFSFFLVPVYLFALLSLGSIDPVRAFLVFAVLHLFLYPAANSFNSVFDQDREGIGGLKNPPPVSRGLLPVSLALDAIALIVALQVSLFFAVGCLAYGLAAKAYSFRRPRIKRYPVAGWLYTSLGQGFMTALLVAGSVGGEPLINMKGALVPAAIMSLLLMGFYPLTQVYQHQADGERGDLTVSRLLGVRKTFFFSAPFLCLSLTALFWYILSVAGSGPAILYVVLSLPGFLLFVRWFRRVLKDPSAADWDHAFALSLTASAGLNLSGIAALACS